MGIMSALGGMAARNPLVTALSGGGLIPMLLAGRKKGGAPEPIPPGTGGQNYKPFTPTPGNPGGTTPTTPSSGFFG